jgi:ribosomal protein L29
MADLKDKSVESLQAELLEKREALRLFRFGGAGSRSRDVRAGRNLRKDIARILTVLNGRVANTGK